MKESIFIEQLADYCEFEEQELTLNTPLKSIAGYDSFAVMSMIAFIDEKFNMKLSAIQLQKLTDLNSLILMIGEDKFEND